MQKPPFEIPQSSPAPPGLSQFKVFRQIPEPTYFKAGPPPAKPPFRVKFAVYSKKPVSEEPLPDKPREAMRRHELRARSLCELHLGKARWVLPDGRIFDDKMPCELFDGIRKFLFRTERPVMEILIDFDVFENGLYGNKLPDSLGPIKELKSGYSCEVWRLFLTCRNDFEWRDLIVFRGGSFYLYSIVCPQG